MQSIKFPSQIATPKVTKIMKVVEVTNDNIIHLFKGRIQSCAARVKFNIDFKVSRKVIKVDDLGALNVCP